jgi:hypothetical protein
MTPRRELTSGRQYVKNSIRAFSAPSAPLREAKILRRATTIIEIVAAIVILSIALPPLVVSFADAARQSIYPVNASTASFLAIERMEEIVARRYRDNSGYDAVTTANFPDEAGLTGFPGFARTVAVSYVDQDLNSSGSDVGYKLVRVGVTWNGGASEIRIERVFADFE